MDLVLPLITIFATAASSHQIYNLPSTSYDHQIYQPAQNFQYPGYTGQSQPAYNGYIDQSQAYANPELSVQQQRPIGEKGARILSQKADITPDGYSYGYETENGIKAEEIGQTVGKSLAAQGAYSYTGDDGQVYTVTYVADENGFRAQGAHLPTPPPTPEAILKSLEQNAKEEAGGVVDDGSYKEAQQINNELQQNYQPDYRPPSANIDQHQHQSSQYTDQLPVQYEANFQPIHYANVGTVAPQLATDQGYHYKH